MKILNNIQHLLSAEKKKKQKKIVLCQQLIEEAGNCTSFKQLLACQQRIFSEGFSINNLNYKPKGMFRTTVTQLTLDSVYLGNICGLFIKSARYWESSKDYVARDICFRQWQNAIIANLSTYCNTLENDNPL